MARRVGTITSLEGLAPDALLTLHDVAGILREDYSTTYERVAKGELHSIRLGIRSLRVEVSALRVFLEGRRLPRRPDPLTLMQKKRAS